MNNKLEALIKILEEMKEGKQPSVPYQLHSIIRTLHYSFGGTVGVIEMLNGILEADI